MEKGLRAARRGAELVVQFPLRLPMLVCLSMAPPWKAGWQQRVDCPQYSTNLNLPSFWTLLLPAACANLCGLPPPDPLSRCFWWFQPVFRNFPPEKKSHSRPLSEKPISAPSRARRRYLRVLRLPWPRPPGRRGSPEGSGRPTACPIPNLVEVTSSRLPPVPPRAPPRAR